MTDPELDELLALCEKEGPWLDDGSLSAITLDAARTAVPALAAELKELERTHAAFIVRATDEVGTLRARVEALEAAAGKMLRLVEFELRGNKEQSPWKGPLDELRAALEPGE